MQNTVEYIIQAIRSGKNAAAPFLIAVDGRCASGKTTLAAKIQEKTGCNVIHMDQFFLRPEQRTEERLREPGGNVDYERFQAEVMTPLRQGIGFSYYPFDCSRQSFACPVQIEPKAVALVEGTYSCHPALWDSYHLRIFLTVDPQTQLQRIRERNGEEAAGIFQEKWIPLEEIYFADLAQKGRLCEVREI